MEVVRRRLFTVVGLIQADTKLDVGRFIYMVRKTNSNTIQIAAAFLEFHDTLEAYKYPYGLTQEVKRDTLLTSDEVYNNWVRADISLKEGRK
jgi:hypothetical protein